MEIQHSDNLAVLFIDPVSKQHDEMIRQAYSKLIKEHDFIKYQCVKDSINIENSHQSAGIQLSDFIAGSFSSLLKGINKESYKVGQKLFFDCIFSYLRKSESKNTIFGYGIREVPSNSKVRENMKVQLNKIKNEYYNISV